MKSRQTVIVAAIVIFILVLIFGSRMFFIIRPGERAVIFKQISGSFDKENVRSTGLNVIAPWNKFYKYNVKEQQREETMDVLSKNGLSVNVDVTVRFNPMYNRIGYLHEVFGVDFINTLIVPEVRSSVRQVMGRYTAEEIYSTKRNEVESTIILETTEVLKENNIDISTPLLLQLP